MSQLSRFAKLVEGPNGIINLGIGELKTDCPKPIIEAAKKALDKRKTHYVPVAGVQKLRELVVRDFQKDGLSSTNLKNTIVGAGAKPLLSAAIRVLIGSSSKKEVIIPAPYYPPYKKMVLNSGGIVSFIDTLPDNFFLTIQALKSSISSNTKLVIINSPNNPTGVVWFIKELETLPKDIWFLFDEAYCRFRYKTFVRKSLAVSVQDRSIVVRSFSKGFSMPGLRLGYLTAPDIVVSRIEEVLNDEFGCACSVSQEAGIVAFEKCGRFSDKTSKDLLQKRNYLCGWLKKQGIAYSPCHGAFYVFADFSNWGRSVEIAENLLKKARVSVIPGTAFGDYDGWVRISYAGATAEELKNALKRIEEIVLQP